MTATVTAQTAGLIALELDYFHQFQLSIMIQYLLYKLIHLQYVDVEMMRSLNAYFEKEWEIPTCSL